MKSYISSNEIVPQEVGVVESPRALESIRHEMLLEEEAKMAAFEAASEEMAYLQGWDGSEPEMPFEERILSFWRYLQEDRLEEDWNLTKVIKALHAVPAMDWVYGLGFSSLNPRDKLRAKVLKFFSTVEDVCEAEDWRICAQECRAILSDPLCSDALSHEDIRKMIRVVVNAYEQDLFGLVPALRPAA